MDNVNIDRILAIVSSIAVLAMGAMTVWATMVANDPPAEKAKAKAAMKSHLLGVLFVAGWALSAWLVSVESYGLGLLVSCIMASGYMVIYCINSGPPRRADTLILVLSVTYVAWLSLAALMVRVIKALS